MIIENHGPIDERTSIEAPTVQVQLVELDDRVLVAVSGELDADNVAQLSDALAAAQAGQRGRSLVLDLGQVAFFDAAAVGALLAAAAVAERLDSSVTIVSITAFGRRVLELLGLDDLFRLTAARPLDVRSGPAMSDGHGRRGRSDRSRIGGDTAQGDAQA